MVCSAEKYTKSIVPTDINNMAVDHKIRSPIQPSTEKADAVLPSFWWSLPFLLAAFIQGLPIAGDLQVQGVRWAETIDLSTHTRATSMGYENTIVLALFWGGLYLLSVSMVWRFLRAEMLLRFWPFLLIIVFMIVSLIWSSYPAKIVVNIVHNSGVFAIAYAAAYRYRQYPKILLTHLGLVLGLNLALHAIAVFYIPSFAIQLDGRWCGLTTNANTLGSIGFIALWANGAVLGFTRKKMFKIHLLFFILAAFILVGTQSMTSIISSLVALGSTYILKSYFQNRQNRRIRSGWLSLAFIVVAVMVLLALTTGLSNWSALVGRSNNISGREAIWLSAFDLIANAPLLGYGFDSNANANEISGMVHSSYHNGFLDLAVRGGLLSLFLLMILLLRWFRRLGRTSDLQISFLTCFLPFIFASMFYNLTEVTFFSARNILWITLLVIVISPEILLKQKL